MTYQSNGNSALQKCKIEYRHALCDQQIGKHHTRSTSLWSQGYLYYRSALLFGLVETLSRMYSLTYRLGRVTPVALLSDLKDTLITDLVETLSRMYSLTYGMHHASTTPVALLSWPRGNLEYLMYSLTYWLGRVTPVAPLSLTSWKPRVKNVFFDLPAGTRHTSSTSLMTPWNPRVKNVFFDLPVGTRHTSSTSLMTPWKPRVQNVFFDLPAGTRHTSSTSLWPRGNLE
jgi:hypothetical protein